MDARRLAIFRSVAHSGSLAAAARELGWTQPAVSQHVKALEREVNSPLVIRGARGVRLTDAGRVLLVHADAIAARLRSAEMELAALAELSVGSVRLAAFPSAAATLVPRALAALTRSAPGLSVRLTEAEPPEALKQVESGDVDAALVFSYERAPLLPPHLVERTLGADPVHVVLPLGHGHVGSGPAGSPIALRDLAREHWVTGCARCHAHCCASATGPASSPTSGTARMTTWSSSHSWRRASR